MGRFAHRLQYASKPPAQQGGGYGVGWTITAANVGLTSLGINGASLPLYTGPDKPASGTTISNVRINGGLDLSAGNITVQRCLFQPTSAGQGMPLVTTTDYNTFIDVPTPVTIRDCDFDGTLLTTFSAAWCTGFMGVANMINNYIHHFGSGIGMLGTGLLHDALIEHNYVTDLVSYGDPATTGNHCDAYTIRDFPNRTVPTRQLIVRNNRFDCNTANGTGAFFVQAYADEIDNMTAQGNLLEGSGYQLILEWHNNGYSNVKAINNRMTGTGFGAGYVTGGPGWTVQQENYLYNAGNQDGKGAPVSF